MRTICKRAKDQRPSLLHCVINYGREKFYSTGSFGLFYKLFRVVINLEHLPLSAISTLGLYLLARPMATRVKKPLTGLHSYPCPQILDEGRTDSDKHSSLLQCGINYDRKNFTTQGPGANAIKLFTAVSYEFS